MSKILISYSRKDSADVTGRIYDRLRQEFGPDGVFKDVDSIPLGVDFRIYLDEQVAKCDVFLAVIGRDWVRRRGAKNKSNLDDPDDFVRIEIESALKRHIPIIPVLVSGAAIPAAARLPATIQELSYRNGIAVRPDPDFHRDMDRLIGDVKRHTQDHNTPRPRVENSPFPIMLIHKLTNQLEGTKWLRKSVTGLVLFCLIGTAVWFWPKNYSDNTGITLSTMEVLGVIFTALSILLSIGVVIVIAWLIKRSSRQQDDLEKLRQLLKILSQSPGNISSDQRTQFINTFHQAQNEVNQLDSLRRQQSELRLGDMRAEAASMGIFLD